MRDTVTNGDGYFTFASLAVGDFTYDLTIDAQARPLAGCGKTGATSYALMF